MTKKVKNVLNVPNLRFPTFIEEWEKKKLGEIGNVKMCRRIFNDETSSIDEIPFFKIGSFGKEADSFISKELYLDYKKRFSFPKKGDILIYAAGTIGRTVIYNGEDAYFQDSNIVWIDNDNTDVSNEFLYYILKIVKYNTEGGTIQRLYNSILKSTKFNSPAISEQNRIVDFLSLIDARILTQIKTIEEYKLFKKGMMQKIFTREIRFKDENGKGFPEWQEKRLGEICDIVGGGTPNTTSEEYWNGDIQWFTPTEIKLNFVSKSERTITKLGLRNSSAKILPKGTILLTTRATIGEMAIALEECSTNQGFQSLIVKENHNNLFIFNWVKVNKHKLIRRANGSTFPEISKSEIEKIYISIPCLLEQQKIASTLSTIDEKIDLEAKLLEALEEQKKYFLQNLFI